ncbi:MAG: 4-(cytidine 5'-diphospho)-2-C-methyl-D-erythritol kinase [Peptoniphilaceae bacterium]
MILKSYGKINISLDVVSKRNDGYHNIKTIMQKISIYDELEIKKSSYFNFKSNVRELDTKENLIYKAYKLLENYAGKELPVEIFLKKNLPIAAGLAGGTGNGALTLKAINDLYELNISEEKLREISLKLGADFPYMLSSGTMLASGIGENLTKLENFRGINLIIVNPGYGVSTKEVYSNLEVSNERVDFQKIIEDMKNRDLKSLKDSMSNKMEVEVFKRHKDIKLIKDKLNDFGGASLMSGSGPSVFSLFDDYKDLNSAYEYFKPIYKNTFKAKTIGE